MSTYTLEGPKWTTPIVTWSFAAPGGVFTHAMAPAYEALVQQSMALWDDVTGITLQQAPDGAAADIRVGFGSFGLNAAQIGQTSYSFTTGTAQAFLPGVTVEIEDPAEHPGSGAGAGAVSAGTQTSLLQVIVHEVGHALGLGHSTDPAAVMYPVATAQNRVLDASDLDGIHALYGAPSFAMTDTTTGVSDHPDGTAYAGPVAGLQHQYIYAGTDSLAIAAQAANVFVHTGSGNDAISVASGNNVLDAGQGSNFLTGGSGTDTFFVDGRGGQVSWGTLVNFHAGDHATLWGFTAGVSSYVWADSEGTAGYTGRTLHADPTGGGGVTTSVTFAGMTAADTAHFAISTGTVGGSDYLAITNLG